MSKQKVKTPEVMQDNPALEQLKPKERKVAETFMTMGEVKALNFISSLTNVSMLMKLKQIKESQLYKEIGYTWAGFCESNGLKVRTVDEKLSDLTPFADEFLAAFANSFSNDFKKIKQLRLGLSADSATLEGNTIVYGDEQVEIGIDNKEDIQALLEKISSDIADAQAEASAQTRISGGKDKSIVKMEKYMAKLQKEASEAEMKPEEMAFIQRCGDLETEFTGYTLMIDKLNAELGDNPTPREIAAYIKTTTFMFRNMKAYYETSVERFGPTDEMSV